jgi:hypothetical protein
MQFTPQEMKLIERLRKQDRCWPRIRWFILGMIVFFLAVYGCIAYFLFNTLDSETVSTPNASLVFAIFYAKAIFMTAVAVGLLAFTIRDWHGNVQRMLLLRLLDAQQKESAKDERVG